MKLYIKLGVFLLAISVIAASCSKFVEGEDISPNDPQNASAASLLSAAEVGLFATYGGGQLDRNASIMVQHATGISDQMIEVTRYNILEGDNVNEWELIYADILINTNTLIEKYGEQSPHYAGIARVIQALAIGVATDYWGAVPWTDALRGLKDNEDGFNPFYDSQESILSPNSNSELALQTILDQALVLFNASENIYTPGADDFIHGGDIDAWIKTAYMVKARYAQRLSNRPEYDASVVLGYLTSANLTGTMDDANCIFGVAGNEYNQWFAFQNDRGYMRMCETFIAPLRENNDPRLPFFADSSGTNQDQYVGTVYGELTTGTCSFGPYFASKTSPIPLVSYVEMKFIEAEAKFATDPGGAADAYNEAVIQSVEQVTGAEIPEDFKNEFASETSATITHEKIMTQKYYALVGQIEVYADWRRTGIPSLTPYPGASAIPFRLPTVLDERLYNTNAPSPPVSDIYLPLWWQNLVTK